VSPLERMLDKPTVVLAVAVVAVALNVLLYYGLPVLLYRNPLVPSPPPLVAQPGPPLPAEDSIIVPTPPSKTLLEPKTEPEGN
jgi:hypothetical protein